MTAIPRCGWTAYASALEAIITQWERIEEASPMSLHWLLGHAALFDEKGEPVSVEAALETLQRFHLMLPPHIKGRKRTLYLNYGAFQTYADLAAGMLTCMRNLSAKLKTLLENLEPWPGAQLH